MLCLAQDFNLVPFGLDMVDFMSTQPPMNLDTNKIDDAVLALLYLTLHENSRAWKAMDWDVLSRLHQRGLIEYPATKARSVVFTDIGLNRAKQLFEDQFCEPADSTESMPDKPRVECIGSANGVSGVLCRNAVDGSCFFRVYDSDHNYMDYLLIHDDLSVTISKDAMASFYRSGDEPPLEYFLDHSPEVLGLPNWVGSTAGSTAHVSQTAGKQTTQARAGDC